jgi:hypothetical protein
MLLMLSSRFQMLRFTAFVSAFDSGHINTKPLASLNTIVLDTCLTYSSARPGDYLLNTTSMVMGKS